MATENKKFLDLPGLTAYNAKVKNRIDGVNSNLQSQINALASGSPLVASSTAGMTDTSRVYVNTTDGDWYYYNGASWVSGGTYQSSGVAENSVGIDNIKDGITKFNLYDPVLSLINSTRIRTNDRPYLRNGSFIEFDVPDGYQWMIVKHIYEPTYSYQTVLTWTGSTTKYEVTEDARYELTFRKTGDLELHESDIDTIMGALSFYRVVKNEGNRLLSYFPVKDKIFDITENYTSGGANNNIRIVSVASRSYDFFCENYVVYSNTSNFSLLNQTHLPFRTIKYNLSSYGTATDIQSGSAYVTQIDVVIPNRYALILDAISGVMSVKDIIKVDPNEIILLRNSNGCCGGGVFQEMADLYTLRGNTADIDSLQTTVSAFNPDFDRIVKGINHRGYNPIAPENTIPAFQESKRQGFTYVETDVSFTSDKVPVLLHDATIDRTSNGTGNLGDMTYDQVSQYDFGSWKSEVYAGTKIPTLREFLIVCRNLGLHPYLELKNHQSPTEADVQKVVDIVEECGMKGHVTYTSFLDSLLSYVKNYDEEAAVSYTPNTNTITQAYIDRAVALKTSKNEVIFSPDYNNVTSGVIDMCKAADLPLEVWTIGDPTTIVNLDPYVTGVTSNNLIAGKVLFEATIN